MFLTWWKEEILNLSKLLGSCNVIISFLSKVWSLTRSFQFFPLMLSSSIASYENTLPVVLMVTIWEFFVNGLKRTGQWYSPPTFLWKFNFISDLDSAGWKNNYLQNNSTDNSLLLVANLGWVPPLLPSQTVIRPTINEVVHHVKLNQFFTKYRVIETITFPVTGFTLNLLMNSRIAWSSNMFPCSSQYGCS